MALRLSAIICITSFLLGILFTHWIADSLTLWKTPITDANLWTAASYYNIIVKGPSYSGYFVSGIVVLGATCILWSLRDGEAGNIMFDGGSIFLFGAAAVSYAYSAFPSLVANFTTLPPRPASDKFPAPLRQEALDIASSHLICSVALTGVLALQAGRWWAERADEDDAVTSEPEDEKLAPTTSRRHSKSGTSK
ncbi:Shr3 amino acid permease chaperone [Amylostereum chailletii]|nr:Shr3 amino acid permease chaperone [Amylostereum chailletii]